MCRSKTLNYHFKYIGKLANVSFPTFGGRGDYAVSNYHVFMCSYLKNHQFSFSHMQAGSEIKSLF